ncbi:MAG TPA: hypothetical protein VF291_12755 [Burkholderiaceae bacterium]
MSRRLMLIAAGLLLGRGAFAMCYEVYTGDHLVYRSVQPPVDLSLPLHESVPARFGPGSTLQFFTDDSNCGIAGAAVGRTGPLLTNRDAARAAERGGLPGGGAMDLTPYFNQPHGLR